MYALTQILNELKAISTQLKSISAQLTTDNELLAAGNATLAEILKELRIKEIVGIEATPSPPTERT